MIIENHAENYSLRAWPDQPTTVTSGKEADQGLTWPGADFDYVFFVRGAGSFHSTLLER